MVCWTLIYAASTFAGQHVAKPQQDATAVQPTTGMSNEWLEIYCYLLFFGLQLWWKCSSNIVTRSCGVWGQWRDFTTNSHSMWNCRVNSVANHWQPDVAFVFCVDWILNDSQFPVETQSMLIHVAGLDQALHPNRQHHVRLDHPLFRRATREQRKIQRQSGRMMQCRLDLLPRLPPKLQSKMGKWLRQKAP